MVKSRGAWIVLLKYRRGLAKNKPKAFLFPTKEKAKAFGEKALKHPAVACATIPLPKSIGDQYNIKNFVCR